MKQPVIGDDGEMELRRDEAGRQPRRGEREQPAPSSADGPVVQPADLEPAQVVGEALALATSGEGDHRPVARAGQLLEFGFGLLETTGGDVGGLGAERERLVVIDARESDRDPRLQRRQDRIGADVERTGVLVGQRGGDVLPVVDERGSDVLLGGDQHVGVGAGHFQPGVKAVHGEQIGDVGAVRGVLERGDLGQLAMLGRELGGGRHLDHLGVPEGALGEGREPAQRLDLVSEQIDPHRPVLGGREQVEQAAADRELAAVLDLVNALVAGGDEILGALVEIDQLPDAQLEAVGPHLRVGNLLRQRDRADHDHRRHGGRDRRAHPGRRSAGRRGAPAGRDETRR